MIIKYQQAFEHEVWSNYMTNIRFLDSFNKVIYSRNTFYHNLGGIVSRDYFIPLTLGHILVYEYNRVNILELVVLDFNNHVAYRHKINNDLNDFLSMDREQVVLIAKSKFTRTKFCQEKIELPLFKFFGKIKIIKGFLE